ncbi:hypothetical protein OSB04_004867 [Centaurea solstitialis]|uniref:DUF4283 domain-containing protein n=1 Tax=Centaurea solstitialis TaxID=347529 RepID=A0AA38TXX6_9ASTR|nr:hypothetical protein OSB04_004867 [Centaurea solstitialis]
MDSSSWSSSSSYSLSRPDVDLSKWIHSLRKSMEDEDEDTTNTDVCIFTVPKTLLDTDPDSYIPEQVALGPFHQWRHNVYDMQKYKLAAAKKAQKRRKIRFERVVEMMKENEEAKIRACYHKFLDMDGDSLMWMMAVDMAFLLEFLQVYYMREQGGGRSIDIGSRLSSVVDVSGKKLSHMAILRDVLKLENQIPLFLIKTMLEYDPTSDKPAAETLQIMLMGLYHELSPFQYHHQSPCVDINDCDHLLDFLYHMTVPNNKELGIETTIDVGVTEEEVEDAEKQGEDAGENESFAKPTHRKQFLDYVWKVIKNANFSFLRLLKKITFSRPVTLVMKLPWKIISSLPILKLFKEPVEHMLANFQGETKEKQEDGTNESNPPLIEEITIPSVSPLDVNTEVYLRNLVAYEACVASGPLVMARYTELMNGIIDTKEDARILMDCRIVYNHLKNEKEVADLWNGMSKCVKMTKVPFMDKAIEEVNKRYERTWRVKIAKFMSKYVFGSWKFLTLLAAMLTELGTRHAIIPDDLIQKQANEWALTLAGYFLGKRPAFPFVQYHARRLWKKYGLTDVILNDQGYFFFKFNSDQGLNFVYENGPWLFNGMPIFIQRWQPGLCFDKPDLQTVPLWVNIYGLPLDVWDYEIISRIASVVGEPVSVDRYTDEMCETKSGRANFARVLVNVSADYELPSYIDAIILGKLRKFKTEFLWKPKRCSHCKVFGHDFEGCVIRPRTTDEVKKVNHVVGESSTPKDDGFNFPKRKKKPKPTVDPLKVGPKVAVKINQRYVPKVILPTTDPLDKGKTKLNNDIPSPKAPIFKTERTPMPVKVSNQFTVLEEHPKWIADKKEVDCYVEKRGVGLEPVIINSWSRQKLDYFIDRWERVFGKEPDGKLRGFTLPDRIDVGDDDDDVTSDDDVLSDHDTLMNTRPKKVSWSDRQVSTKMEQDMQ